MADIGWVVLFTAAIFGFFSGIGSNLSGVFIRLWIEPRVKKLHKKYPDLNIIKIIIMYFKK